MSPDAEPTPPRRVGPLVAVVAIGMFATGLGWPGIIGELPFNGLLKDQLHLSPHEVTWFWAVATIAWYCKPVIGLVTDAYPLGGTRRRGYLLWGSIAAGLGWIAFALVPRAYLPLMLVMTGLNFAMVFVSVVLGGLLVETGQRHAATGRLSAVFSAIDGVIAVAAGPVSGWLAGRAFGWTAGAGAAILFGFVPVVAFGYREPGGARPDGAVWASAKQKLRTIVASRAMWVASGLLFLVFFAPGFQTPLYFYQRTALGFTPGFIGSLHALGGVGILVGAAAYGVICRYVPLRTSIVVGIILNATSTLLYLHYDSARDAMLIDTTVGVLGTLSLVPIYDLATRATPKGSESFGFGLLISVRNVAYFAVSNNLGALLYERYGFKPLVWINAGSTLAVLLFLPLIPTALLASRERRAPP
jgi:MFS family permease